MDETTASGVARCQSLKIAGPRNGERSPGTGSPQIRSTMEQLAQQLHLGRWTISDAPTDPEVWILADLDNVGNAHIQAFHKSLGCSVVQTVLKREPSRPRTPLLWSRAVEATSSFTRLAPCTRCWGQDVRSRFDKEVVGIATKGWPLRRIVPGSEGEWSLIETPGSFYKVQRSRPVRLECGHAYEQLYYQRDSQSRRCPACTPQA